MQPIEKRLVSALVGSRGQWKKARVRIFFSIYLCNSNGLFIPSAFLFFLYRQSALQKASFTLLIMFQLINV